MAANRKHFRITVDGNTYDVQVEEISDGSSGPIGTRPVNRPPAAPVAASSPELSSRSAGSSPGTVSSPMAGKVLKIPVKKGDKVAAGDLLVVLEAMKMETNVNASTSGEVKEILVNEGQSVEAGAGLVRIE